MGKIQKFIIVKDRIEIYKDFALNLLSYIIDYQLDEDTLNNITDEDIKNHFTWCFNKVCDEFLLENINFKDNKTLQDYFYHFYFYQFYKLDVNKSTHDKSKSFYEKFWKNIFEFNDQKNRNVINTLIEIYNIFDTSINQDKNILELA